MRAITNQEDKTLLPILNINILTASEIIFCVSFIKTSGLKLIFRGLEKALKRGARITILTSNYLNITEPNALFMLKSLQGQNFSIRIIDLTKLKSSFHPKGYYFKNTNETKFIIGSSNISKSAFEDGVEWNCLIDNNNDVIQDFLEHFNKLHDYYSFELNDEWLRDYFNNYKKPQDNYTVTPNPLSKVEKDYPSTIEDFGTIAVADEEDTYSQKDVFEPIKCQLPALYELKQAREIGVTKGMVIMATGLGKTFLSAFDSQEFKRILFVAHRKEILEQAETTFKKVRPKLSTGSFDGDNKDVNVDILFASIASLGKREHLNNYFTPEHFDYIVVDEFHHSTAKNYLNILDYFNPKFLLGLTATPDRLDNKDVYKLCDYNVIFNCNFKTAINNGWLVPFTYYGIHDEIEYDNIPWRSGKYDISELTVSLSVEKRANSIIKNYRRLAKDYCIGFCASITHANYMEKAFLKNKIKAKALHSGSPNRSKIINDFKNGRIKILFVVDLFNEGIDIPQIDTILFLRPTESYAVFMQQLGRGLRISENKDYLTVIDFVGNYKNSHYKLSYLSGLTPQEINKNDFILPTDRKIDLPDNCITNFDLELIDYFSHVKKQNLPLEEKLIEHYMSLKDEMTNQTSILEFSSCSEIPIRSYISVFGSWFDFLDKVGMLNEAQHNYLNTNVKVLLLEAVNTTLTKLYKIPTLNAFIQANKIYPQTTTSNIAKSFRKFYSNKEYAKELVDKSNKDFMLWEDSDFSKLAIKNPIKYLSQNKNNLFTFDKDSDTFHINLDKKALEMFKKYPIEIASDFQDILNFRVLEKVSKWRY